MTPSLSFTGSDGSVINVNILEDTTYPINPLTYDYASKCGPQGPITTEYTGRKVISKDGSNLRIITQAHLDGARGSYVDAYCNFPNPEITQSDLEGPIKVEGGLGYDLLMDQLHVHPSPQAQFGLGALTGAIADMCGTLSNSIVEAAYDAVQGVSGGVERKLVDTCLLEGPLSPHTYGETYGGPIPDDPPFDALPGSDDAGSGTVMTGDEEKQALVFQPGLTGLAPGDYVKKRAVDGLMYAYEVLSGTGQLGADIAWPTTAYYDLAAGATAQPFQSQDYWLICVGGDAHSDIVQLITGGQFDVKNSKLQNGSNSAVFIQSAAGRAANATPIYSVRFINDYMEAGNNYVIYNTGQGKIPTGYIEAGKSSGGYLLKTDGTWIINPATGSSQPWALLFRDVVIGNRVKDNLEPSVDLKNAMIGVPQFVPDEETWMEKNGNLYGLNPAVSADYDVLLALWDGRGVAKGGIDWKNNPLQPRQDILNKRRIDQGMSTLACDSRTYAVWSRVKRLSDGAYLRGNAVGTANHDDEGYYVGV